MSGSVDTENRSSSRIASVAMVLRDQGMPEDELHHVFTTSDPELVRRYLELHLERLEERLAAQRLSVAEIERILIEQQGEG